MLFYNPLPRIIKAVENSIQGLKSTAKYEKAFREELILSAILIPLSFFVGNNAIEYILLIGSCFLVLIVEVINSAIEAVVDRIGTEHHELSGRAKDMGSAAVFLTLTISFIVWAIIVWQNFVAA